MAHQNGAIFPDFEVLYFLGFKDSNRGVSRLLRWRRFATLRYVNAEDLLALEDEIVVDAGVVQLALPKQVSLIHGLFKFIQAVRVPAPLGQLLQVPVGVLSALGELAGVRQIKCLIERPFSGLLRRRFRPTDVSDDSNASILRISVRGPGAQRRVFYGWLNFHDIALRSMRIKRNGRLLWRDSRDLATLCLRRSGPIIQMRHTIVQARQLPLIHLLYRLSGLARLRRSPPFSRRTAAAFPSLHCYISILN